MDIFKECKIKLFAILILGFIMAEGCQSQPFYSQEQVATVPTKPMATSTLEHQPTTTIVVDIQPTATPWIPPGPTRISTQPSLVSTNTPRHTSDATQPSKDAVSSLSDLIMTWDDVYVWEDASGYDSNIRLFFEDQVHYIIDRSEELDHRCPIECIKQVWSTEPVQRIREDGNEFTYFRKATIITMLAENNDEATGLAESMLEEFNFVSFSSWKVKNQKVIAPLENTEIRITGYGYLYGLPGYHTILATSRGPFALLVISYNPPGPDEAKTEVDLIIEFINVQLYKLEQAGVVP